jgi:hypothetical protein
MARERASTSETAAQAPTRSTRLAALAVGAIAFVVYGLTAARDIFPGDTIEFVIVAMSGGVAHPPGYPLLSALGVLLGSIPLGPAPYRVDLISVLCHTGTVVLVFLTAQRLVRNELFAAAAALLLAFGRAFWSWSLVAETFPLNDLLVAATFYLLVLWHERPTSTAPLFGVAACLGLGLANQQTISLVFPAVALALYADRSFLRGRSVLLPCAAILVACALLPYAYVIAAAGRHPVLNWGAIQGPSDLVRSLLRLDYGTGQLLPSKNFQGGAGIDRLVEFAKSANLPLLVLAAAGAASAYRRAPWYLWPTLLTFLVAGPAFIAYANANVAIETVRQVLSRFYLLPQVVVAPLAAFGLMLIADLLRQRIESRPPWLPRAVAGGAFAVVALELALSYGTVDRSNDHVARNFAEDILASAQPGEIILADGDHVLLPLIYLHDIEGKRPEVTVIAWPLMGLDWYQREMQLKHRELNIPFARYDAPDGLSILVKSNPDKKMVLTGELDDQTLGNTLGIYPRGLTLPIVSAKEDLNLATLAKQTEALMATYRTPSLDTIDRDSFERFILQWYAFVPYRLGVQFEAAKQPKEARTWYDRALVIDPQLQPAIIALRRLSAGP